MRLKAVRLRNFRGYREDFTLPVSDLTALIGRNDIGKSSIFDALRIFFDDAKFEDADICVHSGDGDIRIGCIFSDLPSAVVLDSSATTSLADEYLLNADGDLEIHHLYEAHAGKAKDKGLYAVAVHPSVGTESLLLQKNSELKKTASAAGVSLDSVDLRSNPQIRAAIWSSATPFELVSTAIPLNKEDAKAIWERLAPQLPTFVLFRSDRTNTDEEVEVHDPMKVAIKAALNEVQAELDQIKKRVTERAIEVAHRTLEQLREMDAPLASELTPVFKAEPKWDGLFKLSLTADDQIPLNRRGSGVRRLVLFAFFRAEAERRREQDGRLNIIYAIEEPEASQHPDNQRLLISALSELSQADGCQVLLTTHVPGLAGLIPIESIRHIRRTDDGAPFLEAAGDSALAQIADELGVLPDRRVKVLVCVEGVNDIHFLRHFARILRQEDVSLPDMTGDPRIAVIPVGGSSLRDWVNAHYLKGLDLPEVHIYDSDLTAKYAVDCAQIRARGDGSNAFLTTKREMENYLHPDAILEAIAIPLEVTDDMDVPVAVARIRHEAVDGAGSWNTLTDKKKKEKESTAKRMLNGAACQQMSASRISERGGREEVESWLRAIGSHLSGVGVHADSTPS